jgi:hypothetical protein
LFLFCPYLFWVSRPFYRLWSRSLLMFNEE